MQFKSKGKVKQQMSVLYNRKYTGSLLKESII